MLKLELFERHVVVADLSKPGARMLGQSWVNAAARATGSAYMNSEDDGVSQR